VETWAPRAANPQRAEALRAFITQYADTDAAREAEVDLTTTVASLEQVARRYPGTGRLAADAWSAG
jgi:hypothetical protein